LQLLHHPLIQIDSISISPTKDLSTKPSGIDTIQNRLECLIPHIIPPLLLVDLLECLECGKLRSVWPQPTILDFFHFWSNTFPMIIESLSKNDNWKESFSFYDAQSVGRGSSGTVLAIDQDLVIKIFSEDEEGQLDFNREREIYGDLQRDGGSRYIVKFLEVWEDGLVLERLKSTLRSRLRETSRPSVTVRMRWIVQACKALGFLHDRGIMHGDVGCHNLLVHKKGHVKLCDFAGSKREGETARICYEIRGQHPEYLIGHPTIRTEIFALVSLSFEVAHLVWTDSLLQGSAIFEIYTSQTPYADEADEIVRTNFQEREFPLLRVECPTIRAIIAKCWMDDYDEVSDVCADILAAQRAQLCSNLE
jgi:Protein kinase domain